jgi:hypothetical protein
MVASTVCGFNNLLLLWPEICKTVGLYRHFGVSNDSFGYDTSISCSNRMRKVKITDIDQTRTNYSMPTLNQSVTRQQASLGKTCVGSKVPVYKTCFSQSPESLVS